MKFWTIFLLPLSALAQPVRVPSYTQAQADEAYAYTVKVISPILNKYYKNPASFEPIRRRIAFLVAEKGADRLDYQALPVAHPRCPDCAAKLDFNTQRRIPNVILFVPTIKRYQKQYRPKEFENFVAMAIAHEIIHLELAKLPEYRWNLRTMGIQDAELEAKEEAAAWGITILKIVRPLQKAGYEFPANILHNSDELKKVGDNYRHPAWIAAFRGRYMK